MQLFRRRNICMMRCGQVRTAPERADDGTAGEEGTGQQEQQAHPLPLQLVRKAEQFLAHMERFRGMAVYLSVQELLQVILRETDYLNYVAVKPEGGRRR